MSGRLFISPTFSSDQVPKECVKWIDSDSYYSSVSDDYYYFLTIIYQVAPWYRAGLWSSFLAASSPLIWSCPDQWRRVKMLWRMRKTNHEFRLLNCLQRFTLYIIFFCYRLCVREKVCKVKKRRLVFICCFPISPCFTVIAYRCCTKYLINVSFLFLRVFPVCIQTEWDTISECGKMFSSLHFAFFLVSSPIDSSKIRQEFPPVCLFLTIIGILSSSTVLVRSHGHSLAFAHYRAVRETREKVKTRQS